jgi:hypothetical protein
MRDSRVHTKKNPRPIRWGFAGAGRNSAFRYTHQKITNDRVAE